MMVVFVAGVVDRYNILRQLMFEGAFWLTICETVKVRNEPLPPLNRCVLAINRTSSTNP